MKVAAVQMKAELGNVEANLKAAERLATMAFRAGAQWVILPEFFTSAVAFHPKMLDVALPINGKATQLLKDLSIEHNGVVGGSFISRRGPDCYNTWVLAFPNGTTYFHDKDQPTMWENCYYVGGEDDGVFETPAGRVGAAMCWEFVRSRTARRMLNRVDLVVGGSCWWTLPEKRIPGFPKKIHDRNLEIMIDTPGRFARMLGVPVVHAAHAGEFKANMPLLPGFPYKSHYLGETQIVDASGCILARMKYEDGEGFITADIDISKKSEPSEPIPDRFWIPALPFPIKMVWNYQNMHGKYYYRNKTGSQFIEEKK